MSPGNLTDLIIVGAGGASCGIVEIVEEINAGTRCWNLLGFLDDDPAKIGKLIVGYPVLGPIAAVAAYPAAKLIVGVASYHNRGARHRIIERLACPIERFATIVSPSAKVSRHASIGMGSSICGLAVISHGVTVGNHALISSGCVIGHDARLFDYVTLAANVTICGSVALEEDVYVGAAGIVRDGVTVGAGALVGLGATVFRDVAARDTVVGNPAKSLRQRRRTGE